MPKIFIIPDAQIEKICGEAIHFANQCQSDFAFYLLPPRNNDNPFDQPRLEVDEILPYLDNLKPRIECNWDDLLLAFYDGELTATNHGLGRLFCAGSRYDEQYPCTGVISLKFLSWGILEKQYDYDLQKHAILHLMLCGIIGSYTHLNAHLDVGCLLDLNMQLSGFNKKLKRGYYLCSSGEFNCAHNILKGKYGNAIIRICQAFKTKNYQKIIEINMGNVNIFRDIIGNHGQIAINGDIQISGILNEQKEIVKRIDELIAALRNETQIPIEQQQTAITNFDKIRDELIEESSPNKERIFKFLNKTKEALETLVLSYHVTEAVKWIYESFHFLVPK